MDMVDTPSALKPVLSEKLADSMASALPESIPQRVFGAVSLPVCASRVLGLGPASLSDA